MLIQIVGGITKRRGVVDVLKNSQPPSNGPSSSNIPPLMAPPMMAPTSNNLAPTNFMVPGKAHISNQGFKQKMTC